MSVIMHFIIQKVNSFMQENTITCIIMHKNPTYMQKGRFNIN